MLYNVQCSVFIYIDRLKLCNHDVTTGAGFFKTFVMTEMAIL